MAPSRLKSGQKRVFDSVFKQSEDSPSQPGKRPSPTSGLIPPSHPFEYPTRFFHDRAQAPESDVRGEPAPISLYAAPSRSVQDQTKWDHSWNIVTSYLSLFKSDTSIRDQLSSKNESLKSPDPVIYDALHDVLDPDKRLPHSSRREDLVKWYSEQSRKHYMDLVLPLLSRMQYRHPSQEFLSTTIEILDRAHGLYLHGLSLIVGQLDRSKPGCSRAVIRQFRTDLHSIVYKTMFDRIAVPLHHFLSWNLHMVLSIPLDGEDLSVHEQNPRSATPAQRNEARRQLLGCVESLHNVGLGGANFQIIFAELMNNAMSEYVEKTYRRIWSADPSTFPASQTIQSHISSFETSSVLSSSEESSILPRIVNHLSPSACVKDLCEWIENKYSRLAVEVLNKLDRIEVAWNDVEKWKEMSIGRLAGLRTSELFDIVVNWPDTKGALDDLRTSVTTPQRRLQLTDIFSNDLRDRLLHPGASTLQILRSYISMIWSFHALDHSKVLLDRVAYPLQMYLCSREDTVRIIIGGLLADTEDADGNPVKPGGDKLTELALLLKKGSDGIEQRLDEDLDWNDMDWVPDPVDAGPGYKRSKNADIIGTLIGVLGSQEVFIKEFQAVLGENLLKNEGDFRKEIKLLELLKSRFGESPLQSCEVMIKDIQDSRKVNAIIRKAKELEPNEEEIALANQKDDSTKSDIPNPEGLLKPSLHTKILSRLFWPQLHDDNYRVPDQINRLQQQYEDGFETLKQKRKLTWLPALGQATVDLEFKDRRLHEEVYTWQATVIWAFQSDVEDVESKPINVKELADKLEMDEALVRKALQFWVGKLVLQEVSPDEYAVLETLDQEDLDRSNARAAANATASENSTDNTTSGVQGGLSTEKMQIYWQYIQGMLKNSATQMPLQQIAMMLKMLIADGFPYSNEELQEFLGSKVAGGELEFLGGKYKLKK